MKYPETTEIVEKVARAKNGDKKALEDILRLEASILKSYFSKKGILNDDMQDVIQSVLMKISKNLKTLTNPSSFSSWAKRIATNEFCDYVKKTNRHNNKFLAIKDDHLLIPDATIPPHGVVLNNELGEIIKKTMQNLPRDFKLTIIMRELAGLSYKKIADISSVKIGTVKSRISRARDVIKKQIQGYISGNI